MAELIKTKVFNLSAHLHGSTRAFMSQIKREVFIAPRNFLLASLSLSLSPTSKLFPTAAHRDPKIGLRNISNAITDIRESPCVNCMFKWILPAPPLLFPIIKTTAFNKWEKSFNCKRSRGFRI